MIEGAALRVENISKQYRLGEIGSGTLSHDLNRWWAMLRGKEDPFSRIGEVNDRGKQGNREYVWALKDISFEIAQGQVLGIIGRNGAGKSTLLKILSRVTKPSSGRILTRGRIASLLEVGTGFHPEMTGRENTFLNGAIMGMSRKEIRAKFDEIVEFAGVERYIDTPVKRYSSGMYVRLAFAVAAHLESEILVVDEVLAVGDAEFQKKCMGKMGDVSKKDGRTVLFVSHNMGSIDMLCENSLLLDQGMVSMYGGTKQVIREYMKQATILSRSFRANSSRRIFISAIRTKDAQLEDRSQFSTDDQIQISIRVCMQEKIPNTDLLFFIRNAYGHRLLMIEKSIAELFGDVEGSSEKTVTIILRNNYLMPGNYTCEVGILNMMTEYIDHHPEAAAFEVSYGSTPLVRYGSREIGYFFPEHTIEIN